MWRIGCLYRLVSLTKAMRMRLETTYLSSTTKSLPFVVIIFSLLQNTLLFMFEITTWMRWAPSDGLRL